MKIKVPGGKVWCKVVGKKSKNPPLIIVHGGPGYPHNYLTTLGSLSSNRQVIFYDQLGCGKSDRPTKKTLWKVERFVVELEKIIKTLKLRNYHVLGQSWGAAIAISFALKKPKGLVSLVIADPYLSTPIWMRDAKSLIHSLPKKYRMTLETFIKTGRETFGYKVAAKNFYKKHVNQYTTPPLAIKKSRAGTNHELYEHMWGPEEFLVNGTLKNFDLVPKLHRIRVPTLLLCGRFDEATPRSLRYFQKLLPQSEIKIFPKSAHFPHLTERNTYKKVLRTFLKKHEKAYHSR